MRDLNRIHLWEVIGSTPVNDRKVSYDNLRLAVVAESMEKVMELARKVYPEMAFHSIQKRNYLGKETIIIDKEILKEE